METIPTIPTRKVRGDAKLERITPQQHERLRDWLDRENRTYAEVVELIRAEFSLSVGKTAVACYWQRHVQPHRYDQVAVDAAEVTELPDTKFAEASLKLVRMHAYNALASSEPDLRTAARLLETVRSADRLTLAHERFAFAQRRAAAKDAQAEEKRKASADQESPEGYDDDFANRPIPQVPAPPRPPTLPPLSLNPALFPALCAELRAHSVEIPPYTPEPPPDTRQTA